MNRMSNTKATTINFTNKIRNTDTITSIEIYKRKPKVRCINRIYKCPTNYYYHQTYVFFFFFYLETILISISISGYVDN